MQEDSSDKQHKCDQRKLELVGRAKLLKLNEVGFVERRGRSRILRGQGNVEVFFPEKEDKRIVRYTKRVFRAQYAQYLG